MTFFVTGELGNPLLTKSVKSDVTKNTGVVSDTDGKFQSLLLSSLFDGSSETLELLPKLSQLTRNVDLKLKASLDGDNLFHLEDLEELLYLEFALLNNLQDEEVPEEYYQLIEELIVLSASLKQETNQPIDENIPKKLFQLSERVIAFMNQWMEGNIEKKEQKSVKQEASIKELMTLIESKLAKVLPSGEKSIPRIEKSQVMNNPFPHVLTEGHTVSSFSISQIQQPKQATIQWVVDTTSDQVAREQLVQKLEAILSKSQTRIVNGNQSITIRLNPEHLGTLHIKLQETQHGLVAKLVAHSKHSASLLEGGIAGLKQNLLNANINVDKVEVVYQEQEQRFLHQEKNQEERQEFKESSKNNRNTSEENEQSFEEVLLEEIESNERVGERV
ncbi:flagellar hook-length control protein FliK [Sutcliffiella halmapala]|uniref:flagellar hook-length control protein FliK n=1 Tax=Sutcliffiella halmapala TaxID=79882 RepID=UPI000994F049|nr:flagellar hook-length control protein FliK [Sutcliffiella halmapala]